MECQLEPNLQELRPSSEETENVTWIDESALMSDDFHLFLEDSLAAIIRQYHKVAKGTPSCLKVFIQASSKIVRLQDQKDDTWDLGQNLD